MVVGHTFGVASRLARFGPDVLRHVVHDAEGLSDVKRFERDDRIFRFFEDVDETIEACLPVANDIEGLGGRDAN